MTTEPTGPMQQLVGGISFALASLMVLRGVLQLGRQTAVLVDCELESAIDVGLNGSPCGTKGTSGRADMLLQNCSTTLNLFSHKQQSTPSSLPA